MASANSFTSLLLISCLLLAACFSAIEAQTKPPIKNGLSWTFYKTSCPKAESIIRSELKKIFKKDVGQAAGLLRLHFHDCFVLGCDSSVLLDGSAGGPSEKSELPNLTLRKQAFKIVEDLRARLHKECGRVVSCSDIVAIAARDSVVLTGGPEYAIPLGRRDGVKFAEINATFEHLVGPTAKVTEILTKLDRKGLDATDAVALSGGHTIGIGHCTSFTERLYPSQDPTMDKTFANNLKLTCPKLDTTNTTFLDIRSPNKFDNKYYVDLMNRQGLFTSDQDLYTDKRTRSIVTSFAINESLFFEKFIIGMIKMGQLDVLTGNQGEIRANCSAINPKKKYIESVAEEELGSSSEMR
ncbi:peroxidase 12 [Ricinus communis]|uniref:Peroxidase n=1 Tax=Ricinus communis TaxID=3988 RepID=B9SEA1_RICCO|nr:peroxidase 12 [Ricinus communis]EEF38060.1 Peroxidase 12 precursor, putative [Ricinus communis]|eukprot:XP_002524320.1 peroxidase 12 [Ricinus communis]